MRKTDYKQLRKQIEDRYKKALTLAEMQRIKDLAAVDAVWEMYHPSQNTESVTTDVVVHNESNLNNSKVPYGTLSETVKQALALVPETFTCNNVIMAMKQISSATFNYSSVSNRLKRLAGKEGAFEIIQQGHGKSPTVYKKQVQDELIDNTLEGH